MVDKINRESANAPIKVFSIFALTGWDTRIFEFDIVENCSRELDSFLRKGFGVVKINSIQSKSYSSVLEIRAFGDDFNIKLGLDTYYLQNSKASTIHDMEKLLMKQTPAVEVESIDGDRTLDSVEIEATVSFIIARLLMFLPTP